MSRPKKDIEPWQVYKLARIGCTNVEIGTIVGCSDDTLTRRFADILRKGRQKMNASLRRMQYKAACAGDRTILIWLGKQYLGQRDKQDVDIRITDEREVAEAAVRQYLDDNPEATRLEAIEFSRKIVPEVDKLASELVQ